MFCKECGRNIGEHRICPYCRTLQGNRSNVEFIDLDNPPFEFCRYSNRSAVMAGFLQIFLGAFGIGRFYLGYNKIGRLQILLTLLTAGIGGFVWGFVDGLMILSRKEKYDADGKLLI